MVPSKLSIITITFNDPGGLKDTLNSLLPLLQSAINWEHLIVDSSPDATSPVLKELPLAWPLRHIDSVPPQGVYAAMNRGVQAAEGEFIWILNGGDKLKNLGGLKKTLGLLSGADPNDVVVFGIDHARDAKYLYSTYPRTNFALSVLGMNQIPHPGMIYRSDVFLKVGFFNTKYKIAADYEHHFRCLVDGLKIKCVREVLSIHDRSGISSSAYKGAMKEVHQIHKSMRPRLSLPWRVYDFTGEIIEIVRMSVIKYLSTSVIAPILRPAWLLWRRKK